MRDLDETDLEILRLLVADARRPYREIADEVGLSAPSVSDRIDRLREDGVIRRFTVDLNRGMLEEGIPVIVDLTVEPGATGSVQESVATLDPVEHVFVTADGNVLFQGRIVDGAVRELLAEEVEMDAIAGIDVRLLESAEWQPHLEAAGFAVTCDECGNRVTSEGESVRLDGSIYHFCCESCQSNFVDRYESMKESA
ncbi:MAG: AsnC family transcriptional regulator [Halobacteriales archaeon]